MGNGFAAARAVGAQFGFIDRSGTPEAALSDRAVSPASIAAGSIRANSGASCWAELSNAVTSEVLVASVLPVQSRSP